MRKTFRTAIGWIIIIPLILLLGAMVLVMAVETRKWPALLVLFSVFTFMIHLLLSTNYTIEGGRLQVRCGLIHFENIDILTIRSITETNNPLSSPAMSLDRLDIRYGNRRQVMISPKDKEVFIKAIREINPTVEIRSKKPVM